MKLSLIFIGILLACSQFCFSQQVPQDFAVENAAGNATFQIPTAIAIAPDGRIFVAEKGGIVYIIENEVKLSTPFIDLNVEVLNNGDRGLLGIALDPLFSQNGYVYLYYTVDINGDGDAQGEQKPVESFSRVTRYTASSVNPNVADLNSRFILLGNDWGDGIPACYFSHTGGTIEFAKDGSMLLATGDAGSFLDADDGGLYPNCFGNGKFDSQEDIGAYRSQWIGSLAGKILRIDSATGLGLPSNPYYTGDPSDNQSLVWAYGLRNPFRFAIKPRTSSSNRTDGQPGTLYIGDVGWDEWEDLNVSKMGGENFGWPCFEGPSIQPDYANTNPAHHGCSTIGSNENPAPHTPPLVYWHHNDPDIGSPTGFTGRSVTAGAFYTGSSYPSEYKEAFFFADFDASWMKVLKVDENDNVIELLDFGTDFDGPVDIKYNPLTDDIYYVAIVEGEVRRIRYFGQNVNRKPTAVASAQPTSGPIPLTVQFTGSGSFDPDGDPITFTWYFGNGDSSTLADPEYTYNILGDFEAKLTVRDNRGEEDSKVVQISTENTPPGAQIITPLDSSRYIPGQRVEMIGVASDAEDNQTALQREWVVNLHHNDHVHPDWVRVAGDSASFVPAEHDPNAITIFYVLYYMVTDSRGLADTAKVSIFQDIDTSIGGRPITTIPDKFKLEAAYPNPFNPSTTIEYFVAEPTTVSIKIYDLLGKEVAVLVDDFKQKGDHKVVFDARNLASGIYLYRGEANGVVKSRKMILLK